MCAKQGSLNAAHDQPGPSKTVIANFRYDGPNHFFSHPFSSHAEATSMVFKR